MRLKDFDPHDLERLQKVILEMIRALPADRQTLVMEAVLDEPFTFSAKNAGEKDWFDVWVGERNPVIVGRCHVGALRRDDASGN